MQNTHIRYIQTKPEIEKKLRVNFRNKEKKQRTKNKKQNKQTRKTKIVHEKFSLLCILFRLNVVYVSSICLFYILIVHYSTVFSLPILSPLFGVCFVLLSLPACLPVFRIHSLLLHSVLLCCFFFL